MNCVRALILVGLFTAPAAAQMNVERLGPPLQPGTPIERQIGPGQVHTFTVAAPENSLVQITVEQKGIDVVVQIYTPAGRKLGEFDTPNGAEGPENVSFVTSEKEPYRVHITPLNRDSDTPAGRYQIKIIELREATDEEIKTSKNVEALKGRAVALLGEIEILVSELKVPQTRVKTQLQIAQMLWEADEKRATKYLNEALAGVKELFANVDPESKDYTRNYYAIAHLRHEIIQVLMHRQPELALNFLRSTPPLPDPYGNQREQASQDSMIEIEIANQLLKNDPKRTLEIARENLKTDYTSNLVNTVIHLREKHPELAAELAGEIATKVLGENLLKNPQAPGLLLGLLNVAGAYRRNQPTETNGSEQPRIISEQQYRDLLQKALREALAYKPPASNQYSPERDQAWSLLQNLMNIRAEVDAVISGGGAAVEKKIAELESSHNNPMMKELNKFHSAINDTNTPFDDTLASIARASKEHQDQLYIQMAGRAAMNGDIARAKQIINDYIKNPYQRQQALANIDQQETHRAIQKGKAEEALKNIANISNAQERAQMLAQFAGQIGPGQKRAAALQLLEQARGLLSPSAQAPDQVQMNAYLEIARAFSRYDSKRAFEIVEPLVDQFNELTIAARTLEGFAAEFYDKDELNLQNGNAVGNVATQLTTAIGTLALGNFDRAKMAADRLRLPEIRLRAYIDIAQQALNPTR